ncbi:hypothetical protein LIER_14013 [Lithospermum erythrorhizon]|uniref:non-specific serine/threonine protein kinase n=1 Tax=Lithospermum erythrorhizon TaxID=34254 RepID=A0AAV3PYH6_LITER
MLQIYVNHGKAYIFFGSKISNNRGGMLPLQKYIGDLSFNNLTGSIPEALFNMSSLVHLFLGNNKLVGSLPTQKSSSLRTIDVSFNELSGGFPSWVSQNNLNLNFVANNFTIGDSDDSSSLPRGLDCLQRNFPCNRGSPIYSSFAIKCGGLQITSSDQIIYETDNETLGPANYYMPSTGRWAVSNVGLPTDTTSPQYKTLSFAQYGNTIDSELFQTARVSVGSLRYYGLGLENGNYTLNLQFAEGSILNPPLSESGGRRMFDVYIQGNQVLKDFDVRRAAGDLSFRAVQRTFEVQVSENFMEIHFFWAGKGTCCIPSPGTYGPTISAISATPNFVPTVRNIPPSEGRKSSRTGLIVGLVVGLGFVSFFALLVVYYVVQKRRRQSAYEDEEFLGIEAKPYTFSYAELRSATNDFNSDNKLGEGGFGPVYKGTLNDERVVAIKRLSVASNQGKSQFVAEIAAISAVQHRNLVKLYGCCIEGDNRLLVYEYLENKSLDKALFEKTGLHLDWPTRFDVCLGVARGLAYLHEESRVKIVHRDVKASNILLDSELNPKISDFGLAKLYDEKMTHISTHVAGTFGYLAPEYAMRGHLTEKADVFSFGVVALEMVSGRPNSDSNLEEDQRFLLEWTWRLHESNHQIELVDKALQDFDEDEVKRVIGVALMCTQTSLGLRPSMSRVVAMLSGDIEVAKVTTKPGYLTGWSFNDKSSITSNVDSKTEISIFGSTAPTTTDNTSTWNYSPVNVSDEPVHSS